MSVTAMIPPIPVIIKRDTVDAEQSKQTFFMEQMISQTMAMNRNRANRGNCNVNEGSESIFHNVVGSTVGSIFRYTACYGRAVRPGFLSPCNFLSGSVFYGDKAAAHPSSPTPKTSKNIIITIHISIIAGIAASISLKIIIIIRPKGISILVRVT